MKRETRYHLNPQTGDPCPNNVEVVDTASMRVYACTAGGEFDPCRWVETVPTRG